MALLALALAVTATKLNRYRAKKVYTDLQLNKLRAEKAHTDPPHNYNQTAVEGVITTEKSYEEMEEWTKWALPGAETWDNGREAV